MIGFGISKGGYNAPQSAVLVPPALKSVIWAGFADDRDVKDVQYVGGVLSNDNCDGCDSRLAQNDLPPAPVDFALQWRGLIKLAQTNPPWAHDFPPDVSMHAAVSRLQKVGQWCDHWMTGLPIGSAGRPHRNFGCGACDPALFGRQAAGAVCGPAE